jgi:putative transcriptional regulator
MQVPPKSRKGENNGYLDGQFLVAMPAMSDKRFARSVIYMCAHWCKAPWA